MTNAESPRLFGIISSGIMNWKYLAIAIIIDTIFYHRKHNNENTLLEYKK